MSPLEKQVVRRYLAIYAMTLVVMTAAIIAFDTVKVLRNEGLTPLQTTWVIPFLLPAVARTAMQGAVLFAACFVYGRMAAMNELLALNASGLSISRVIWPATLLSIPLSLAAVLLEDVAVTWGNNGVRRTICEAMVDIAYGRLDADHSFRIADYELTAADVDGRTLIHPMIKRLSSDPEQSVELAAEEGKIEFDRVNRKLVVSMKHGTLSQGKTFQLSFFDDFVYAIPLDWEPSRAVSRERIREQERKVAALESEVRCGDDGNRDDDNGDGRDYQDDAIDETLKPIPFDVRDESSVVVQARANQADAATTRQATWSAPTAAVSADTESTDTGATHVEPPSPTLSPEEQIAAARSELVWLRMQWHQKWANSFCCLSFTLIGIPLAVRLRRTDFLSTFMVCFLPVLAIYQPLQYFGCAFACRGLISPLWLHLNNLILWTVGSVLLYRLLRRR